MQSEARHEAPQPLAEPGGLVVWVLGRPSAGKSTLATTVRKELSRRGKACVVLDGDDIRKSIVPAHDYSPAGRDAFYSTLARLAATLSAQGIIVVVAATANLALYRARARKLCHRYIEVFVDTPADDCAVRDDKGLYAATSTGSVTQLPGKGAPFEPPEAPDVVAHGGHDRTAVDRIIELVTFQVS
ncbi:MAG: adenylyl-sulfate kinase [Polyangiaceae bacterium]|nr:adenylyl-sulfate kinase [Polyangiaceae bacterium]